MDNLWLLLQKTTFRHWKYSFKQNVLLILVLSLGVGVYFSIRLANRAAIASFTSFTTSLTGQSDWIIEPTVGYFKEDILNEVNTLVGSRAVHIIPVCEATATETSSESQLAANTYTILGIDLIAMSNLPLGKRGPTVYLTQSETFWSTFRSGPHVWVPPELKDKKTLSLIISDNIVTLPVVGIIPSDPERPKIPPSLLVMDLPDLQKLSAKQRLINRIEFIVEKGPNFESRRDELGKLLINESAKTNHWNVKTEESKRANAQIMTQAFSYNLTILSLIALLVGLYLLFQAMDSAVVRRRLEIAVLRSLGVSPGEIRALWIFEAALLGLLGGLGGIILGWIASYEAVKLVGRTVNALYFSTTVSATHFEFKEALITLLIAIATSILAGLWPAKEAAEVSPAQELVRSHATHQGNPLWKNPTLGLCLTSLGFILLQFNPLHLTGGVRLPFAGYCAALAWIAGFGMLCAASLPLLGRYFKYLGKYFTVLKIAGGYLTKATSRHRLSVAALVCAIGMCAGMAILVASFEKTIKGWIGQALQADLYLYSASSRNVTEAARIPESTWKSIATNPHIQEAWILSTYPFEMSAGQSVLLTGNDLRLIKKYNNLQWVEPPRELDIFDTKRNEGLVIVSESFSERYQLHRGMHFDIPFSGIKHSVTIAAVFADYGNERGSIIIDRQHLVTWSQDNSVTHISLIVKPGINPGALRLELLKQYPGFNILSNSSLRDQVLVIFHQTFSITYALEIIGVVVAVAGIGLTMTSILSDRFDELVLLRSLGFTHTEIAYASALEGLALALWSLIWGIILSLGLGWILIYIVNKQAFGWTLGTALPYTNLFLLGISVTSSGFLLSYIVAYLGSRLPVDKEKTHEN